MSKKDIRTFRRGTEFVQYIKHHPHTVDYRQTGSHFVGETKRGIVVVPNKSDELGKGLREKIVKIMFSIGLGIAVLIWVL